MTSIVKVQPFPATKFFTNGFLDEFFNRNIGDFVGGDFPASHPATNVTETDQAFEIHLAAPGFDKQDFSLNVEGGQLTVTATHESKTETNETNKSKFLRREFRYESFKRSFKLPVTVNQDAISAVYDKGILNITLPKKEEAKPVVKSIEIA